MCQVRLAHLLWHFGDAEGALALGDEALSFAEDLAHPYTLLYVLVRGRVDRARSR